MIDNRIHYFQASIDKSSYKKAKKYVRHWRRVERKFNRRKKMGRSRFTLSFKHIPLFGFFDNESLIENLAEHYGYYIIDEKLTTEKSTYVFSDQNPIA